MNTYLSGSGSQTSSLDYTLPSTFKIEFDYKLTSLNGVNSSLIWIGESSSKALLLGRISGNDTTYQVWARNISDLKTIGQSITASNDWQTLTLTYDGSKVTFNGAEVTNFNGVSLNKLVQLTGYHETSNQGIIRNIKIKPL